MEDKYSLENIVKQDYRALHNMLDDMETQTKKVSPSEALAFIQPIKDMFYEAMMDLIHHRNKHIQIGEDLLNNISGEDEIV